MKFNINELFINQENHLFDALKIINEKEIQIVLVVDNEHRLIGTITDGDIRRGLLRGLTLDSSVDEVTNKNFHYIKLGENPNKANAIMSKYGINQVPVLNINGVVVDILGKSKIYEEDKLPNSVVIMAGGLGKRLLPHTSDCPKPMLMIGDKPILEIILLECISYGLNKFYISVNYLKDQILDYFQDGKKWNVSIEYLIENEPLGTAGSLHLIPKTLQHPFLILNGDVLTKLKPNQLINYHLNQHSHATICAREYQFNVPFGVIETNGLNLTDFKEKPDYKYLVNAGLYVLDPKILTLLHKREEIDMPELLIKSKQSGYKVKVCPIHEYWIDIGRPESLKQAHKEWDSSI